MASAVATPLERQFSRIAGVTQMTFSSGSAPRALPAVRSQSRTSTPPRVTFRPPLTPLAASFPPISWQPTYRKANPADAPILMFSLTSDNIPPAQIYDAADSVLARKLLK